jgi:hypothetical protein
MGAAYTPSGSIGDAAGAARSTAGRSDYEIIRQFFRIQSDFQVSHHGARPGERGECDDVQPSGRRRLSVNPGCKQLIRDLERVRWKADSNDNLPPQLDKTNPGLTHVSDALGYLIEAELGLRQRGGPRSTPLF